MQADTTLPKKDTIDLRMQGVPLSKDTIDDDPTRGGYCLRLTVFAFWLVYF